MIALHYEGPQSAAVVLCDICHQRIDNGSLGVAVFRAGKPGGHELLSVMHAHKGACHDAAVVKLGGREITVWEELVKHLQGQ